MYLSEAFEARVEAVRAGDILIVAFAYAGICVCAYVRVSVCASALYVGVCACVCGRVCVCTGPISL